MTSRIEIDPAEIDGTRMSEEDYLALPEIKAHVELVDGLVVWEPSDYGHQRCVGDLLLALMAWRESVQGRPEVCLSPLDVRFAPSRILQPDLFVYLEPLAKPVRMPITRVPDLCIEVVTRRHAYDRISKPRMYAEAGVREVWTVVPAWRIVERWTGPRLATREDCSERLRTPILPGFELDVVALLPR
jgi:Uma2 family endonuclease